MALKTNKGSNVEDKIGHIWTWGRNICHSKNVAGTTNVKYNRISLCL